ncbi:MAG: hypothetical protein JNM77_15690 [Pseudonocardia sp.]|nr:hypothetical protein [Pseudonocardia sp.]
MRLILDVITVAVVGFTTVVAAWMVVRGLRRTGPRLVWAVLGTTAVAGLLQWVGPPVAADEPAGPPVVGTTGAPTPWFPPAPASSRTPPASTANISSAAPPPGGAPGAGTVRPRAARSTSLDAPVPSATTEPDDAQHRSGAASDPTRGATR